MIPEVAFALNLATSDISDFSSRTVCPYKEERILDNNGHGNGETFYVPQYDVKFDIRIEIDEQQPAIPVEQAQPTSSFEQKIFKRLPFPRHWEIEGIARPNMVAKIGSFELLKKLWSYHQILPTGIAASIEEGICLTYDRVDAWEDHSLIIEVYNDLSIALIVTDNNAKKTIYREDAKGTDLNHAVEIFKNPCVESVVCR
jgi:hypothetical protein